MFWIIWQVEICCAVTGHAVLYGRIDPYLDGLKLYEHCYITGPVAHSTEVIQLYAKIGQSLAVFLRKYTLLGLYTADLLKKTHHSSAVYLWVVSVFE